jgi:hypothetical protein
LKGHLLLQQKYNTEKINKFGGCDLQSPFLLERMVISMPASYPSSVKSWADKQDNIDDVFAGDTNGAYAEIIAIESELLQVGYKRSVRVATTANGALATAYANGQTVDGIVLATGDRILLKDQTAGAENGIYIVNASGAPTRAVDANTAAHMVAGLVVYVREGTTNAKGTWKLTTTGAIILGTTALTFENEVTAHLAETAKVITTFTQLQEAVQSATPLVCSIGRQIDITSDITIPEDFALQFTNNGKLNIAAEVTLTINGYIAAGIHELFIGDGTVTGNVQNDYLLANWFGVVRDAGLKIDQTAKIAKFLNIANIMNTEAFFLKGDYYLNEIDVSIFVNKGGITICGEGKQSEYNATKFYCLDKTQIQNSVGAFIFLSDTGAEVPAGITNRNITIHDITLIDDDVNITNYGLYANGVTFANIDNIATQGFKTGVALGRQWNSEYNNINIYDFSEYGLYLGPNPVANATTLHKIHCSTSKAAIANIYCDQNRSCVFYELTTEGSALTHVKFEQGNESFIVFGWHVEGGKNLFEIKDFTMKFGNIEVYGANIFLGENSALADSRLFLFTNCTGLGGIATLTMRGSLQLHASTHADYLSLNRIYNSDIMLNFNVNEPTADFINVGSDLLATSTVIVTCDIKPIGYHYARYPLRKGIVGTAMNSYFKTATSMNGVPTTIFTRKEARGTKCLYYDVDLYLTSDTASTSEFAKFMVGISEDGTLTQTEISSVGANAKNVTFSWDNATQTLKLATNHAIGYYTMDITERISRI